MMMMMMINNSVELKNSFPDLHKKNNCDDEQTINANLPPKFLLMTLIVDTHTPIHTHGLFV